MLSGTTGYVIIVRKPARFRRYRMEVKRSYRALLNDESRLATAT